MKTGTRDALLEIGVEPLPARFVPGALAQLDANARKFLSESRLPFSSLKAIGSYRRLALLVEGLPEGSEPVRKRVTGPPAKLLKDEKGNYTPQALGFAKAQGISPDKLSTAPSPRGELLAAEVVVPGVETSSLLGPIFKRLIESLQFPKTMHWEASGFRFGRPIRSLIALYGQRIVRLEIAGVRAGRSSPGLSLLKGKPIRIQAPANYASALKRGHILLDPEERKKVLVQSIERTAKHAGLEARLEPGLIEETVHLTEYPVPILGKFRDALLELPPELIVTTLRKHLDFFPLYKEGRLQPRFIGVRDGLSEGLAAIRTGYERVVEARLDDAAFYFQQDRKTSLEEMRSKLSGILFHEKLGTLLDKSERVRRLTLHLCEEIRQDYALDESAAESAARLAYADLASQVVGEFPELQGRMGGAYARLEGLPERVALGLEEFYRPEAAKSPLPATIEGSLAALAGKLDTLAGDFAVGLVPSGNEDPHGLRRHALGAWRILLEKGLPTSLFKAVEKAVALQPAKAQDEASLRARIEDFIWQRAEVALEEAGFKIDEIRSIREGALENIPRTLKRLAALHAIRPQPEFASVAQAFKRASNILRQAAFASNGGSANPGLFKDEAETELYDDLNRVEGQVRLKLEDSEFEESLLAMVGLKRSLDRFFEEVLVMAESEEVRRNRLLLLAQVVRLIKSIADLSQLQG